MLRYDNCCPANENEAHRLDRAMRGDEQGFESDWIIFKRFVAEGAPVDPTWERWKSFNITCAQKAFDEYGTAEEFLKQQGFRKD